MYTEKFFPVVHSLGKYNSFMVRTFVLVVHFLVTSFFVVCLHIFFSFILPDVFPTVRSIIGNYNEFSPFFSIAVGFGASYIYFRVFKVDNPLSKAGIATAIGTVMFWGSCIAILCVLAPGLSNM